MSCQITCQCNIVDGLKSTAASSGRCDAFLIWKESAALTPRLIASAKAALSSLIVIYTGLFRFCSKAISETDYLIFS